MGGVGSSDMWGGGREEKIKRNRFGSWVLGDKRGKWKTHMEWSEGGKNRKSGAWTIAARGRRQWEK